MPLEHEHGAMDFVRAFSDPQAVARYVDGPRRYVPGLDALHRMAGILIAERVGPDARVLVLGAGGGLELRAMADAYPGWSFVGVDPARPMLDLAASTLGPHLGRAELVEGHIEHAPEGPFDAAVCLLTLHFLDEAERVRTAREIRRRLRPGAPFVVAHGSYPQDADARGTWLDRYAAFAVASGADADQALKARAAVAAHVNMFSPDQDESILRQAGFAAVDLFYAAFTWRGWIAHA